MQEPVIDAVINFDKPTAEYCAGEILSGNVTVTLRKPLEIVSLKIVLLGLAECDVLSKLCEPGQIYYGKSSFILDKAVPIFQYDDAEVFAEGEYTHSFSEELPKDMCESFGIPEVGYVKYCTLVMITSLNCIDGLQSSEFSVTKEFEVLPNVPVPQEALEEVSLNDESRNMRWLCICCPLSAGNVNVSLSLDKGGYLPGQTIKCNATLSNDTTLDLYEVKMFINQRIEYILRNDKESIFDKEISTMKYPKLIRAREVTSWENVRLTLPVDLIATNLDRCELMKLQYNVTLTVKPSDDLCASMVQVSIPFFLGSSIPPVLDPSAVTLQPTFI